MPFGLDDVQDGFPVYLRGQYLLCISTKSPCPKAKPCTHIALVNESTIPPSSHAFVLGIGPTEEERIRQRWRDFTDVLLKFGDVVGYTSK